MDAGLLTNNDIDKVGSLIVANYGKGREREQERCRKEIQEEEQQLFSIVNAFYFDGRRCNTVGC